MTVDLELTVVHEAIAKLSDLYINKGSYYDVEETINPSVHAKERILNLRNRS